MWKCSYNYGNNYADTALIEPFMLDRDPELNNYKAQVLVDKLHKQLFDLLVRLRDVLQKTDNQLTRLYNDLLLGQSSTDEVDWINDVENWIRRERPELPSMERYDLLVVVALCEDLEKEADSREHLLQDVEDEIMGSVNKQPGSDFNKVKRILDDLKDRYNNLNISLKQLKKLAEDLLKSFDLDDDLKKIRINIRALVVIVLKSKPTSKGLPGYIPEMVKQLISDHSNQIRKLRDHYNNNVRKPMKDEIDRSINDMNDLKSAIDDFNNRVDGAKAMTDYINRGKKLNDKIEELNEDLDGVELTLKVEEVPGSRWDPADFEPMIEVAEAELAGVRADKNSNLDPKLMEFVLDGIELIDDDHPETPKIKKCCEEVQDNFEELEKRLNSIKLSLDRAKVDMPGNDTTEINVYVKYLSDMFSNPLLQSHNQTDADLKRGSLLLEKGEGALDKLRDAARKAENQGRPTDKLKDVINRLSDDYRKKHADMNRKLRQNEFILVAEDFKQWCDKTYSDISNSVDKKHLETLMHAKKVADLNVETRLSEYHALVGTGEVLANTNTHDPEETHTILRLVAEINIAWRRLEELRDFITQLAEGKKLHRFIKSEISEIDVWVSQTKRKISLDKWEMRVYQIQLNKTSQGEIILQMDGFKRKLDYIDEGLQKLGALNFGISDKLKDRLKKVASDLEELEHMLDDRQKILDDWDDVINLIPVMAYEHSWIEDQLLRTDVDWQPDTYNDTAIKVKKLSKLKLDIQKRGINALPENIPLKLDEVEQAVQKLYQIWNELLSRVNAADVLISKSDDFFKWKTLCVVFIDQVNQLVSDIDPEVEENSVASLTAKLKHINLLESNAKKFRVEYEAILDDSDQLDNSDPEMRDEVNDLHGKIRKLYETMNISINYNKNLIHNLLERAKLVSGCEELISYDSRTLKKILVLDRCSDLSLAARRLNQFTPLEERIKASSTTINKLTHDAEIINSDPDSEQLEEIIGITHPLKRALEYHDDLIQQSQQTLDKIKTNVSIYEVDLDDLFLKFYKLTSSMIRWIDDVEEYCTDGVFSSTIDQAKELKTPLTERHNELSENKKVVKQIAEVDAKIKDYGLYDNPYTWVTFEEIEMLWRNIQNRIREQGYAISNELHRQETNDRNKRTYGDYANQIHGRIAELREDCVNLTGGYPEEKHSYLKKRQAEIRKVKEHLRVLELKLGYDTNVILKNYYTEYTINSLEHDLRSLEHLIRTLLYRVQQELELMDGADISAQEMQEIRSSFYHFDEDKSQRLGYTEFKHCLRSLGFDVGPENAAYDPKFQSILDIISIDRSGYISIEEYVQFMVMSARKSTIASRSELISSFKAMTANREEEYILPRELKDHFHPVVANNCIARMNKKNGINIPPDALDYVQFANSIFGTDGSNQ